MNPFFLMQGLIQVSVDFATDLDARVKTCPVICLLFARVSHHFAQKLVFANLKVLLDVTLSFGSENVDPPTPCNGFYHQSILCSVFALKSVDLLFSVGNFLCTYCCPLFCEILRNCIEPAARPCRESFTIYGNAAI